MKIKVVATKPVDGQEGLEKHIGQVFQTLNLKTHYDTAVVKEMTQLGEVAVLLESGDKSPSILNKNEYEILPD